MLIRRVSRDMFGPIQWKFIKMGIKVDSCDNRYFIRAQIAVIFEGHDGFPNQAWRELYIVRFWLSGLNSIGSLRNETLLMAFIKAIL